MIAWISKVGTPYPDVHFADYLQPPIPVARIAEADVGSAPIAAKVA